MAGSRRRRDDDDGGGGDLKERENGGDATKHREREDIPDRHSGEKERESRRSEGKSSHRNEDVGRRRDRDRRDKDRERDRDDRRGRDRKEERRGKRRDEEEDERPQEVLPPPPPLPPLPDAVANAGRSGGVYIPPFKMAQMMREVQDKSSEAYQRLSWDALRKSINGLVNKVNATNIKNIIPELFSENLIRGRGLFCRSCMKSQMASPGFTDVFAALVAVVNTKFPEVGKLLLRRIVLQLKRAYKRNDKVYLIYSASVIFYSDFA